MTARILADDVAGRLEAIAAPARGRPRRAADRHGLWAGRRARRRGGLGRLFAAKHRPLDKGIVLLLADHHQADAAGIMTPAAHVLAAAFWPGGLTLVVPQRAEAGSRPSSPVEPRRSDSGCPPTTPRERWRQPSGPCPCHRPTGRASRRRSRPPRWSASSATARTCPSFSMAGPPEAASHRRSSTVRAVRHGSCAPARSRPMSSRRSSTRRGSSTRSGMIRGGVLAAPGRRVVGP